MSAETDSPESQQDGVGPPQAADSASEEGSARSVAPGSAEENAEVESPPSEQQGGTDSGRKQDEAEASAAHAERPAAGTYQVALPTFEGPLDLLLHLIQQHELDIKDIPIAFISEKYVEYIMLMQHLNIDLASEYLVMAATLAHIKSKMLLPAPPADQEDDAAEEMDPRSELVRRLLEYQKYKHAAEELGHSKVLGRDVFLRGAAAPNVEGPAPLAQVSVFKLFDAFQRVLGRVKQTAEHHIDVDRISISERILQLTDLLKGRGQVPFESLFDEESTRADIVVTFLALLEMTRLRMMQVLQEGPLAPICVELTLTDEHQEVLELHSEPEADPLAAMARGETPPVTSAPSPDDGQHTDERHESGTPGSEH